MKTAGIYRFSAINNIQGKCFLTGKHINPDSKDSKQVVLSSWIVELGEFESTTKMESGPLKAFFTEESDTVRYAYVTQLDSKPRQTVFIGTVNGTDFLRDKTGNRRFMVLPQAGPTDIESLNSILGWKYSNGSLQLEDDSKIRQFWLEVKNLYDNGHGWILPKKLADQAEDLNKDFLELDPLEERFHKYIEFDKTSPKEKYNPSELCEMIGLNPMIHAKKMGRYLSHNFPNSKARRRINGKSTRLYLLPKIKLRRDNQ